jgi:uncharacterized FlaG/YvyC family protein
VNVELNSDHLKLASTPASAWAQSPEKTPDTKPVIEAVKAINRSELFGYNRELRYSQDARTKEGVVEILDRQTGEQIAKIPAEAALQLADFLQGSK